MSVKVERLDDGRYVISINRHRMTIQADEYVQLVEVIKELESEADAVAVEKKGNRMTVSRVVSQ